MTDVRVLVISDSPADASALVEALEKGGYLPSFERVFDAEGLALALDRGPWDVVLSDYQLERFGALPALSVLKERDEGGCEQLHPKGLSRAAGADRRARAAGGPDSARTPAQPKGPS